MPRHVFQIWEANPTEIQRYETSEVSTTLRSKSVQDIPMKVRINHSSFSLYYKDRATALDEMLWILETACSLGKPFESIW
jgi:hypothetical protein